jgi:nucleotide-binding universal stress UspA family protein
MTNKEELMFEPKNILVPTDFSEDSDRAFFTALEIAGKGRSRIFLLHVISRTVQMCISDYCIDQSIADRILSEGIVYSNEKLRETIARFPDSRTVKVIPDLRKGQPHEEILKEASERKVDLIVIASHGKTGLKKYFIGSVAERVMKEARCAVLLIRNPDLAEAS